MASTIHVTSAGVAGNLVSVQNVLRTLGHKDCVVAEYYGETFVYLPIEQDTADAPQVGEVDYIPPGAVPRNQLPIDLRAGKMNYKKHSVEQYLNEIRALESPKIKAFRLIMGMLASCGIQSSVLFENMLNTEYQLPYTALTQEQTDAFKTWLGTEFNTIMANCMTKVQ